MRFFSGIARISALSLVLWYSGGAMAADARALMNKFGCGNCHAIDRKLIGPAYMDVAARYRNDASALPKLVRKVRAGGSGVWGQIPMPPNNQVKEADIRVLVEWILSLRR